MTGFEEGRFSMVLGILKRSGRALMAAAFLLVALPAVIYTFSLGPPLARTGGFGEPTCADCHTGTPLNGGPGSVTIGAPAFYTPGATVPIPVTIQDSSSDRRKWGFELSARFRDGRQAGSLTATTPVAVQTSGSGIQYAAHQPAGIFSGNSFTFTVNWTAPADASGGDVVFNAAGNAANGDSSSSGDHIYTSQVVAAAPAGAAKISAGGVVNAATFVAAPNNTIAPGALVSIFGTGLAPTTAGAAALPLPTALAGTQVTINGIAAPLIYVSPTQINAQAPFELTTGSKLNLVVKVAGLPDSTAEPVQVDAASPGIFAVTQSGAGSGAILHANFSLVNSGSPARPGETVLIYCTGLGATTPAVKTGAAGNGESTVNLPTASIGGQNARVDFSGAAPGFAGLYQINAVVPTFTAAGDYEVLITIAGKQSRTGVTIRVQP
jgi:uncharacterized protein (TIGR03437 family)